MMISLESSPSPSSAIVDAAAAAATSGEQQQGDLIGRDDGTGSSSSSSSDSSQLLMVAAANVVSAASTDPAFQQFRDQTRFWIQRVAVPLLMVIGVFGNSITVIIMTRRRMRSTTNMYLAALALVDMFYLILTFVLGLSHYPNISQQRYQLYWHLRPFLMMLTDACSNTSVWLTVTFTIERFIAVKYPMKGKIWCTESRARLLIICVFVFGILFAAPVPFEWKVIEKKVPITFSRTTTATTMNTTTSSTTIFAPTFSPATTITTTIGDTSQYQNISYDNSDRNELSYQIATIDKQQQQQQQQQQTNKIDNFRESIENNDKTEHYANGSSHSYVLALDYSDFGRNETYKTIYYWSTAVIFYFIPLLSLTLFNGYLIKSVHQSKRERNKMTEGQQQQQPQQNTAAAAAATTTTIACNNNPKHNHANQKQSCNNNNNNEPQSFQVNNEQQLHRQQQEEAEKEKERVISSSKEPEFTTTTSMSLSTTINANANANVNATTTNVIPTNEVDPSAQSGGRLSSGNIEHSSLVPSGGGGGGGSPNSLAPTDCISETDVQSIDGSCQNSSKVDYRISSSSLSDKNQQNAASDESVVASMKQQQLQPNGRQTSLRDLNSILVNSDTIVGIDKRPAGRCSFSQAIGKTSLGNTTLTTTATTTTTTTTTTTKAKMMKKVPQGQSQNRPRTTNNARQASIRLTLVRRHRDQDHEYHGHEQQNLTPINSGSSCGGSNSKINQATSAAAVPTQVVSSSASSQERRITIMLIAVVILFLFCQIPSAAMLLYTSVRELEPNTNEHALVLAFGNIFNFLMAVNAAGNFILYSFLSKKYRKTFVILFCYCLKPVKQKQQLSYQQQQQSYSRYSSFRNTTTNSSLVHNRSRRDTPV